MTPQELCTMLREGKFTYATVDELAEVFEQMGDMCACNEEGKELYFNGYQVAFVLRCYQKLTKTHFKNKGGSN